MAASFGSFRSDLDSLRLLVKPSEPDLPFQDPRKFQFTQKLSSGRLPISAFSVPVSFVGRKRVEQENALLSWLEQGVSEVILMDHQLQVRDVAQHYREYNVRHVPSIERNVHGTPILPSIFSTAETQAQNDLMMYVNSDILLYGSLAKVLAAMKKSKLENWLVVARRIDVRREMVGRLGPEWTDRVHMAVANGLYEQKNPCYVDVFLYNKTSRLFDQMPRFALGRFRWDNWLTDQGYKNEALVDATAALRAVHIHHHTKSYASKLRQSQSLAEEISENHALSKDMEVRCINHAQWQLVPCGDEEFCVEAKPPGETF